MASLSSTTQLTRLALKWLGIGIVATLGILILFRIGIFIKSQITPPPPPNTSFGKLPQIKFPPTSSKNNSSYTINTLTGSLPVFSDRAYVYEILDDEPQLLALSNTSSRLSNIGFEEDPTPISDTTYEWIQNDESSKLPKKIIFDIFSGDYNLSSPFLSDSSVLSANNLPNQTAAIEIAKSFMSSISPIPDDIDFEKTKTNILAIKNGRLEQATSLSNTQVVKVSFLQRDLNGIPVIYSDPNSSTANVFVSGGPTSPQVVKADFFHQSIASSSATYPIISANQAFDKLKKGEAFITNALSDDKISINKVFLAYYISDQKQKYAMPVVVFMGEGFSAYVSAIVDSWIQK